MRSIAFAFLTSVSLASSAARAEPDPVAKAHFEKGVAAFNKSRFDEALEEFLAAYDASHESFIFYDIGEALVALGRPVEAMDALERYLSDRRTGERDKHRPDAIAEIEKLRAHIGTLSIRTAPAGADLTVDGRPAGSGPLDVRVIAGHHSVEAAFEGYAKQSREVDVGGATKVPVDLTLTPTPAPEPPAARLEVPAAAAPSPPRAPPPAGEAPAGNLTVRTYPPWGPQRIAGYVLGGAGVAIAGVGAVLIGVSVDSAGRAKARMGSTTSGEVWDSAKSDYDNAKNENVAGWIVMGAGAAALVGGILLTVTAPRRTPAPIAIVPWVGPREGGVMASGSWGGARGAR